MGNQSARQLSTHRKHVVHTWNTINSHDPQLLSDAIRWALFSDCSWKAIVFSEAWLKSAELTPTWVWALVDLPETMHATYKENAQFLNIINQVRDFLNILIKVHKCDPEMIKTLSFRLGARHRLVICVGGTTLTKMFIDIIWMREMTTAFGLRLPNNFRSPWAKCTCGLSQRIASNFLTIYITGGKSTGFQNSANIENKV